MRSPGTDSGFLWVIPDLTLAACTRSSEFHIRFIDLVISLLDNYKDTRHVLRMSCRM